MDHDEQRRRKPGAGPVQPSAVKWWKSQPVVRADPLDAIGYESAQPALHTPLWQEARDMGQAPGEAALAYPGAR